MTTRAYGHEHFGHFSSWFARAMAKHTFAVCGQVLINDCFKVNFTYHEFWLLKLIDEAAWLISFAAHVTIRGGILAVNAEISSCREEGSLSPTVDSAEPEAAEASSTCCRAKASAPERSQKLSSVQRKISRISQT